MDRGCPPQRRVGPFDRFNRRDHAVAYRDRLSDIELAQGADHAEGDAQVLELSGGGRGTGKQPGWCDHLGHHRHRIDYLDTFGFDFGGKTTQHCVITEALEAREHLKRARVGGEGIREPGTRDPARHRSLTDAGAVESVYYALKFTDLNPGDLVHQPRELFQSFILMSDRDNGDPTCARGPRDFKRKASVAGDEAQPTHDRGLTTPRVEPVMKSMSRRIGAPNLSVISTDPNAPGVAELVGGAASFGDIITRDQFSNVHLIATGNIGARRRRRSRRRRCWRR